MPGWVRTVTSSHRTQQLLGAAFLSGLDRPLCIACARCARNGRYGERGLLDEFGDISIRAAMLSIAANAGCRLARNPPAVTDMNYAAKSCQIRRQDQDVE